MARLNDLPGQTESIEALKRRFVRQNREIARVNSLQSLRIQSLESELSHLLKENAALREQVISLTQDAEKFAAGRAFHKDLSVCKEKFAAKVSELNSLVSELGMIPESFLKKTAHLTTTDSNIETQRPLDPDRRPLTWDEHGDRLPTILEDKYFPRRTLDPEELAAAAQQDLDSPTIGSPPVAHFDVDQSPLSLRKNGDFNFATKDIVSSESEDSIHSDSNDNNSSNSPDASVPEQPASPSKSVLLPVLSGSKRKFSATEDDITFSSSPATAGPAIDDDFQFTRAVDISRARRPAVAVEVSSEPTGHARKQQQKKGSLAKRRVLEPKSTNMASSPKKNIQQVDNGKPENIPNRRGEEENARKTEPPKKASQFQPDPTKKPKRATTATIHEDEAIKSTSNNHDSVGKERQRKRSFNGSNVDEPAVTEPMPIPSLTSRPSRRARGAISYAEPNLRDKMRRATNELIDAVVIEHAQRTAPLTGNSGENFEPEKHESSGTASALMASPKIPNAHDNQGIVAELPKHMITERKRRTLSASTNEITHLNKAEIESDLRQDTDADGTRSPSTTIDTTNTAQEHPRRRSASTKPQARRHSSNPAGYDRGKSNQPEKFSSHEASELDNESHDNDTILEDSQPHKTVTSKDIGAASTARVRGAANLTEDNNSQITRNQRASSRRRSTLI